MSAERTIRKPSGKPSWPIILLAGMPKAGKTYAAAQASASDEIGRTFWIGIGELDPNEYGAIPGADFEIVDHDGTYRDILAATSWAAQQPVTGHPNLIVVDSGSRLWDLLSDMAQREANTRAATKARKSNRPVSDEDARIAMDLWNTAAQRWAHVMDALRAHNGPSIITSRMEETAVVDERGEPTKDRVWKVKAHKSLPYEAQVVVEMRSRGDVWLSGVQSLRWQRSEPAQYPGEFTVVDLWTKLGVLDKDATSPRSHAVLDAEDRPTVEADAARAELLTLCEQNNWPPTEVAAAFLEGSGGIKLTEATAPEVRDYMAHLTAERAA